ncbi:MAG: hypothetical protein A2351_02155 [Omnitrophica bacterium RIFOXYB12_FULL_50_7]|nr:MAG: hypothetical protein A2351_02155 [Omnitrophica bacterium RIFOXYB12_FULL_50_7]
MIGKPLSPSVFFFVMVLSFSVLLGGYTYLAREQHKINPLDKTIPTWSQLGQGVVKIVVLDHRSGKRWIVEDSAESGKRLFLGFFWGILGAILIGLLIGCFQLLEAAFAPPLAILAKLPPTAALALFFVMLGTGTGMYVGIIVVGLLPALAQSIYLSIKAIPTELINKALTLGASRTELVWNIIIRYIFPNILDSIRLQIGPALVYLIAAEYACAQIGFGYRIRLQARLVNMDVVYPYLALLILFGFFMDWLLKKAQAKWCAWYVKKEN